MKTEKLFQKVFKNNTHIFDLLVKYLTATIILTVPLYPKFPLIRIPGTFVSIRLEDLLILSSALVVILIVISNLKKFLKNRLNQALLLFFSVGLVSLLSGIFITKTVQIHIGFLHFLRRVEYIVPFFLGLYAIKGKKGDLDFYFKVLVITVLITFIYGFGQRYFSWPVIITQNQEYSKGVALRWVPGSHINSTFAGHYDLATFLVLIMPIIVISLFVLKGFISRGILLTIIFSGLWLLVNSASRISLVSYLISSSFALLLIKKYRAIVLVIFVSLIFVNFSSNLLDRYKRLIDVSVKKFQESKINDNFKFVNLAFAQEETSPIKRKWVSVSPTPTPVFEDRSTNIRLNVEWPRALRAFFKNPLLGTGYSSITLATDNDFLRLLGEVGILGFTTFLLIFYRILRIFYKVFPFYKNFSSLNLAFVAGTAGALPGLFINALFIDIFEASKFAIVFWLTLGLSIGLIYEKFDK